MKKIFSLMLLAAVSLLAASCHGEGGEEGTLPPGNDSGYYEFPLNVQEGGFKASGNGVSIEVTSLESDNIVFDLVPGSAVKSYRVEVYPKVMIYNLLLNEGCLEAETAVCEDKIIQLIRNSTSAGSHVFSASSSDDFAQKEFDWQTPSIRLVQSFPIANISSWSLRVMTPREPIRLRSVSLM